MRQTKEEKNHRLKQISQQIEQSDIENIKQVEMDRRKFEDDRNNYLAKIAVKEHQIIQRRGLIRHREIKIKQELKRAGENNRLLNILAFCEKSVKCAEEIMDTIMLEIKEDVEKKACEHFLSLIWKKNTYKGMYIDNNYNISVPHMTGREALGTLSAGERQVCALSFLAALNSVSGFDVPIIIDTPLGRLSKEPRRNIAKKLPKYLKGTQVSLLVTEEEYTKEVKDMLSKNVFKTYLINFSEEEKGKLAEVEEIND